MAMRAFSWTHRRRLYGLAAIVPIGLLAWAWAGKPQSGAFSPPAPQRTSLASRDRIGDYESKQRGRVAPAASRLAAANSVRREILVYSRVAIDPYAVARQYGLHYLRRMKGDQTGHVMLAANGDHAAATLKAMGRDSRVRAAFLNYLTPYRKAQFVPNDAYFNPSGIYPGQWNLLNQVGGTTDINVWPIWQRNYTGSNVVIGIVDDGVEILHPDLSGNYQSADSYDFGQNDAVPNPVYSDDNHGTSVAGMAAARGKNSIGTTGVAPYAKIAGLRVDFAAQIVEQFADATTFHSSGANTNIKVKNHSYGIGTPFVPDDAAVFALETSAATGTIHVLAAGNERDMPGQDSNKSALQASPAGITVAALADDGRYATYSSFGSNVFCTAPSSGGVDDRFLSLMTTDRRTEALGYNGGFDSLPNPDYTSRFGGTSASAPTVAGVMAIGRQVNNALTGRLARHILARTCTVVHPGDVSVAGDGGWRQNGAGLWFNPNYGFGLVNTDRFVEIARRRPSLGAQTTETTGPVAVGAAIPDNNPNGLTRTFTLTGTVPLEAVMVRMNLSHTFRGDVEATLTSPSGMRSRLFVRSSTDDGQDMDWTFLTNAFWGEIPAGTWTLKVIDTFEQDTGFWNSFQVTTQMGLLRFNDAKPVGATVPTVVEAGKPFAASVTMQNLGSTVWTQAGKYALGPINPQDTAIWGTKRYFVDAAAAVKSNSSATFALAPTAPATPGLYNFQWKMVQDGVAFFGDPTTNVPIRVAPAKEAEFVAMKVPTTVKVGTKFSATVIMRNLGATPWTRATLFRLGSQNPAGNTTWGFSQVFLTATESIPYGETKTFVFSPTAPAAAGTYSFQWKMLSSTGAFGEFTTNQLIRVTL